MQKLHCHVNIICTLFTWECSPLTCIIVWHSGDAYLSYRMVYGYIMTCWCRRKGVEMRWLEIHLSAVMVCSWVSGKLEGGEKYIWMLSHWKPPTENTWRFREFREVGNITAFAHLHDSWVFFCYCFVINKRCHGDINSLVYEGNMTREMYIYLWWSVDVVDITSINPVVWLHCKGRDQLENDHQFIFYAVFCKLMISGLWNGSHLTHWLKAGYTLNRLHVHTYWTISLKCLCVCVLLQCSNKAESRVNMQTPSRKHLTQTQTRDFLIVMKRKNKSLPL